MYVITKYVILFLLLVSIVHSANSKKAKSKMKTKLKGLNKQPPQCKKATKFINNSTKSVSEFSIQCSKSYNNKNGRFTSTQQNQSPQLIPLINIESDDCDTNNIMSKKNKNLFFVESSGRNHLTARFACAVESAIKNSGLKGNIIVAMTSKYLDISANNATCHLYSEHAGKNMFFRYVNVDTIFQNTLLHRLHVE